MKNMNNSMVTAILAAVFSMAAPLANAGKPNRPPPPPAPSEPPARAWHGFTDNGSAAPDASLLYLFGGAGSDYRALSDLWVYSVPAAKWSLAPTGKSKPSGRQHMGFSCGAGLCVAANGSNGVGDVQETWVYSEAGSAWSKANCRRNPCPSARQMTSMAYDGERFYHLLFGGLHGLSAMFNDTYTFSNTTRRWTRQDPPESPEARHSAGMAFVGGPVNRVVLLGGQIEGEPALCDMWSWSGTTWEVVEQVNWYEGPCLHSHSMAWDGARLVVAGGYMDVSGTPNEGVWTFEFTPDGAAGEWTHYADLQAFFTCTGVMHPGTRMAFDRASAKTVYFGGVENIQGRAVLYADTSVCE